MVEQDTLTATIRAEVQNGARSIAQAWTTETALRNINPLIRRNDGRFGGWVRDMERYFLIAEVEGSRKCQLALITTAGQVGDYISRIISADPGLTWNDLKTKIGEFCKQIRNPQEAFLELANIRQRPDESMLEYIQRIECVADGAYDSAIRGHEIVKSQVRDFFIEGIRNTDTKLAVLRAEPHTLEEACQAALTENRWQQRARVPQDRWEEPMEVCHARRRPTIRQLPNPRRNYGQLGERNQHRFEPRMHNHGPPSPRYNTRPNPGNGMRPSGRGQTDGRRN